MAKKNNRSNTTTLSPEIIEEKIKEAVASRGEQLNDQEKELQIETLKKVLIDGKSPMEALGITPDFLNIVYRQAYDLYNLGQYDQANQIFRLLCLLVPDSAKYQLGIAATNHKMGNYELAISMYFAAWYFDIESPIPLFYISDCYMKTDDNRAAKFVLKMALELCEGKEEYSQLQARCEQIIKGLNKKLGIEEEEKEEEGQEGDIFRQLQEEAKNDGDD